MIVKRLCVLFLTVSLGYCKNSTQSLLDADFLTQGQSAIELIAPLATSTTPANPALAWTSRNGIGRYQVQISERSDFASLVLDQVVEGTSYVVQNSHLRGIASLDARLYYWRVQVPGTRNALQSSTGQLNVLTVSGRSDGENILYVDGAFDPSLAMFSYGNKSNPYRSIQRAIDAALILRNDNNQVPFEIRVASGTYAEEVQLRSNVTLKGGYEKTTWSRNISVNTTTISAPGDRAVFFPATITAAYKTGTSIDGFTLNSQVLTPTHDNYGAYLAGSGSISNCIFNVTAPNIPLKAVGIYDNSGGSIFNRNTLNITANTSAGSAQGITLASVPESTISNNTININMSTSSGSSHGIQANTTGVVMSTQIFNNRIVLPANGGTAYGIQNNAANASATIYNNSVQVTGTGPVYGIASSATVGSASISNNSVYVFTTNSDANAIYYFSQALGHLNNNAASAGTNNAGNNATAIMMPKNGNVDRNIAFCSGASTNRRGFFELDANTNPASFTNNLVFDSNFTIYGDFVTGNLSSQIQLNTPANTVGAGGTSTGNLAPWATAYGPNSAFVFKPVNAKGTAFSSTDPSTWDIKGYVNATNGMADIDQSGGWTAGDIGPDFSRVGPQ